MNILMVVFGQFKMQEASLEGTVLIVRARGRFPRSLGRDGACLLVLIELKCKIRCYRLLSVAVDVRNSNYSSKGLLACSLKMANSRQSEISYMGHGVIADSRTRYRL